MKQDMIISFKKRELYKKLLRISCRVFFMRPSLKALFQNPSSCIQKYKEGSQLNPKSKQTQDECLVKELTKNKKQTNKDKQRIINEQIILAPIVGSMQKSSLLKKSSRAKILELDTQQLDFHSSVHRWVYKDGLTPNRILIVSWNVNGLRSIMSRNMLLPFIREVNPDIICLNQTKMDERVYDLFPIDLPGYSAYWNFPKFSHGYSGIVVFSKYLPISCTQDFDQKDLSYQGRLLTIHFESFILLSIYVPMSGKQLQRLSYRVQKYDVAFRKHCSSIKRDNPSKVIIICGDLNVAHTELDCHPGKRIEQSPSFTRVERKSMSELLRLGFRDVYRELNPKQRIYTWWNEKYKARDRIKGLGIGRRLDYFLVNEEALSRVNKCNIHSQVRGSDHSPISLEITLRNVEK